MKHALHNFVVESNRIEWILRPPTPAEIDAHAAFLALKEISVEDLVEFVSVIEPDAMERFRARVPGVRVGSHIAPKSGKIVLDGLYGILQAAQGFSDFAPTEYQSPTALKSDPYSVHCAYETLHPFTDGNGRSGRVLWLWMMYRRSERDEVMARELGFLHSFYYQSLEACGRR